jgi:hypothetical protein
MADRSKEDARLKALLNDGLSYDQCGVQLAREGFPLRSRHAHIGRAFREGFAPGRKGMSSPKPVTPKADRPKPARQALAFNGRFGCSVAPAPRKPRVVVVERSAPPPAPLPFDRPGVPYRTATRAQCAYPLWGDALDIPIDARRVCGEPAIPGESYCPACHGVAYRPTPRLHLERSARSYARHGVAYRPTPRLHLERSARSYARHDGVRVPEPRDETPDLCAEMA